MKKLPVIIFIILLSLAFENCQEKTEDSFVKNAPLIFLAIRSMPTIGTPTTTPTDSMPSSCNASGISTGCNSNQSFSCSATSTCFRTYELCAADTSCKSFSYSRRLNTLRIGDIVGAGVNPFSGNNITYSVSSGVLPEGLNLNTISGLISGTTTTAFATSTVTISATNKSGSITSTNIIKVFSVSEATPLTCNSTGINAGCTASSPFSCARSVSCFATLSACQTTSPCLF